MWGKLLSLVAECRPLPPGLACRRRAPGAAIGTLDDGRRSRGWEFAATASSSGPGTDGCDHPLRHYTDKNSVHCCGFPSFRRPAQPEARIAKNAGRQQRFRAMQRAHITAGGSARDPSCGHGCGSPNAAPDLLPPRFIRPPISLTSKLISARPTGEATARRWVGSRSGRPGGGIVQPMSVGQASPRRRAWRGGPLAAGGSAVRPAKASLTVPRRALPRLPLLAAGAVALAAGLPHGSGAVRPGSHSASCRPRITRCRRHLHDDPGVVAQGPP